MPTYTTVNNVLALYPRIGSYSSISSSAIAFYITQAENEVKSGKKLFSLQFPVNKLYNFKEDPDGLIKSIRHPTYGFRDDIEWTELFSSIHENYDGAFYSTPRMDVVVLFEPAVADKMERE